LERIPFNRPHLVGTELKFIGEAASLGRLAGDGDFTKRCSRLLAEKTQSAAALLTHSCTAALEMAAVLLDIRPGDEIIMPSYTFVSTANAFVLRGATPVFVDIRPDTLNLDEERIEGAISARTKAIVPVHYAGVSCEMDRIMSVAVKHGVHVVEDAAQGIFSSYKGKPLGSIGQFGALSFHETKNVICGEGGALLVNEQSFIQRAEIIREKGTNRSRFFRGEIDKYTWVDIGSSYLPGELVSAFLYAQLLAGEGITHERMQLWLRYHEAFKLLEFNGCLRRPYVPDICVHNAHMYYVLLKSVDARDRFISFMSTRGIHCVFHYVPLHSSEYGSRYGRIAGPMSNTDDCADRLVRLPLWVGLESMQGRVIDSVLEFFA